MTEAKNRVLQKGNTHGEARHVSGSECEELARNAIALFPDRPAHELVPEILEMAEPEFLDRLERVLEFKFWIQTVKALRARDRRAASAQEWLFPEIQQHAATLPQTIPVGRGVRIERAKLRYEDLQNYLKVLNQRNRERHEKRIAAVTALMELWPPRTKKLQGITLAEVDATKARTAGLIA